MGDPGFVQRRPMLALFADANEVPGLRGNDKSAYMGSPCFIPTGRPRFDFRLPSDALRAPAPHVGRAPLADLGHYLPPHEFLVVLSPFLMMSSR